MRTEKRAFSVSWASWNRQKCPKIVLKFSKKNWVLQLRFLLLGALLLQLLLRPLQRDLQHVKDRDNFDIMHFVSNVLSIYVIVLFISYNSTYLHFMYYRHDVIYLCWKCRWILTNQRSHQHDVITESETVLLEHAFLTTKSRCCYHLKVTLIYVD